MMCRITGGNSLTASLIEEILRYELKEFSSLVFDVKGKVDLARVDRVGHMNLKIKIVDLETSLSETIIANITLLGGHSAGDFSFNECMHFVLDSLQVSSLRNTTIYSMQYYIDDLRKLIILHSKKYTVDYLYYVSTLSMQDLEKELRYVSGKSYCDLTNNSIGF